MLLHFGQIQIQVRIVQYGDPSDDRAVHIQQRLHGGHQKRARSAGRVEYRQLRQHIVEQAAAEISIKVQQGIAQRLEASLCLGVQLVENRRVDGAFTQVAGDLGAGVVGTEGFLVDVLLEDVAQHIRVDLVAHRARRIVQVPRIMPEQRKHMVEGRIRNPDCRIFFLKSVFEEQTTVQILDRTQQRGSFRAGLGLGKPLKKQGS